MVKSDDANTPAVHQRKSRVNWRRFFYRSCAVAFGFIVAATMGELTIRLFFFQTEAERWYLSDPRYGHRLKPDFYQRFEYPSAGVAVDVRTNSIGLRDREYDFDHFEGLRVLLIGDSFTFGEGLDVSKIFDTKLEERFVRDNVSAIVINAGVGGWGTAQATLFAADHFELFKPDVIVLTFCGNDPDDDEEFFVGERDDASGRIWFPGKIFLRNHSHLYPFVRRTLERIQHTRNQRRKRAENPDIAVDPQSSTAITEAQWISSLKRIRDFRDEFIAFQPGGLLLVQSTYPWNESIRKHLGTLSDGAGLQFVDVYDQAMTLGAENARLPYDGHWTEEMHDISAEALYGTIRSHE